MEPGAKHKYAAESKLQCIGSCHHGRVLPIYKTTEAMQELKGTRTVDQGNDNVNRPSAWTLPKEEKG